MPDINPGSNGQSVINANPAGTTYTVKAGTHAAATAGFPWEFKTGDIVNFEAAAILDGGGTASRAIVLGAQESNVTLKGVSKASRATVRNFVPGDNQGAIDLRPSGSDVATDCTIKFLEIVDIGNATGSSGASGIKPGTRTLIEGCFIHRCDRYALQGLSTFTTVRDCDLANCGHPGTDGNRGIFKDAHTQGSLITLCRIWQDDVSYEPSVACWFDINDNEVGIPRTVVSFNDIWGFEGEAIEVEISHSVDIHHNRIRTGGGPSASDLREAAIFILCSHHCEVYENVVYDYFRGITVRQTGRYRTGGILNKVSDVSVHHNTIILFNGNSTTHTGMNQGNAPLDPQFTGQPYYCADPANNNTFDFNDYFVEDTFTTPWIWPDAPPYAESGVNRTFAGLQSRGQEANGSVTVFSAASPPDLPAVPTEGSGGGGEPGALTVHDASTVRGTPGGSVTNWVIPYPTPVVAGELLLGFLASDGAPTFTWPLGWTEIQRVNASAGGPTLSIGRRVADGTETGNFTVTLSAAENGGFQIYRIADQHADLPEIGTAVTTTTLTPNPPSLSPSWGLEETLWFAVAAYDKSTITGVNTYPANYTNGVEDGGGATTAGARICTAYRHQNLATEDPGTFDLAGTADDTIAQTLAVRPAAAGGSPPPPESPRKNKPHVKKLPLGYGGVA